LSTWTSLRAGGTALFFAFAATSLAAAEDDAVRMRPAIESFAAVMAPTTSLSPVDVEGADPATVAGDGRNPAQPDAPQAFAVASPVSLTPDSDGLWEEVGAAQSVWRLRIRSAGARSLNLGFGHYKMTPNGRLLFYATDGSEVVRPFTAADNELHGQLWTPVIRSDDVIVEVVLPATERRELELEITSINVGFRGFAQSAAPLSGACNVDVICPEGAPWSDELSSVGVYTVNGTWTCSGALINNMRRDREPYFLTAHHCNVGVLEAPTVVVYWNYETSICGGAADGSLADFQAGATHKASYANTDFTLLLLDDPPDASWGVSFAGWDRSGADATKAVGIHHPNTDEKRISFENDPTTVTSHGQTPVPGDGTHIRVADWDLGVTEEGSSGSPLFDQNHRIIGQLHGGDSDCDNQDESDWYGRFSVSWNGGGTAATRLKDWLDPDDTGMTALDTKGARCLPDFPLAATFDRADPAGASGIGSAAPPPRRERSQRFRHAPDGEPAQLVSQLTVSLVNGTLSVTGTATDDQVELYLQSGGTQLVVHDIGAAFTFPPYATSAISSIEVATGDGADLVLFNDQAGVVANVAPFRIDGGDGSNLIAAGISVPQSTIEAIVDTLENATSLFDTARLLIEKAGIVDPVVPLAGALGPQPDFVSEAYTAVTSVNDEMVLPAARFAEDVHPDLIAPAVGVAKGVVRESPPGLTYDVLQLFQDAYTDIVQDAFCTFANLCDPATVPSVHPQGDPDPINFNDDAQFLLKDRALQLQAQAEALKALAEKFDQGLSCKAAADSQTSVVRARIEEIGALLETGLDCPDMTGPDLIPNGNEFACDLSVRFPSYCSSGPVAHPRGAVRFAQVLDGVSADQPDVAALLTHEGITNKLIDCAETQMSLYRQVVDQCEQDAEALRAAAEDGPNGLLALVESDLEGPGETLSDQADLFEDMLDAFELNRVDTVELTAEQFGQSAEALLDAAAQAASDRVDLEIAGPGEQLATGEATAFDNLSAAMATLAAQLTSEAESLLQQTLNLLDADPLTLRPKVATCAAIATVNQITGGGALIGSSGNDLITGDAGFNVIAGLGGDDRLHGLGGIDLIFGGSGTNELEGDAGIDLLVGGNAVDCVYGQANSDVILGRDGDDVLFGGPSTDVILGLDDDDHAEGGNGMDVLLGSQGADTLLGGDCTDVMLGGTDGDSLFGGDGQIVTAGSVSFDIGDVILGQDGPDVVHADDEADSAFGVDVVLGGDGADAIYGANGGNFTAGDVTLTIGNVLLGQSEADLLIDKKGIGFLHGGDGSDTLRGGEGTVLSLDSGSFTLDIGDLLFGAAERDFLHGDEPGGSGIDFLFGGPGNDDMYGYDGGDLTTDDFSFKFGNLMVGGSGADTMVTLKGVDVHIGGSEDDTISAGNGSVLDVDDVSINFGDLLIGNSGNDTLHGDGVTDTDAAEDDGMDVLLGGPDDDVVYGGEGGEIDIDTFNLQFGNLFIGAGGNDKLYDRYFDASDPPALCASAAPTEPGFDFMFGGAGDDWMFGAEGDVMTIGSPLPVFIANLGNLMIGDSGNDRMCGADGIDLMISGRDDDVLIAGDAQSAAGDGIDILIAGRGRDELRGGHGGQIWVTIDGVLTPIFFGNLEIGGRDDDALYSNGRSLDIDVLLGNDCNDLIHAGGGLLDIAIGGRGDDELFGEAGIDLLIGGRHQDVIHAGDGLIDLSFGGKDNDLVDGEADVNLTFGGRGDDVVQGGGGILELLFGNREDDTVVAENGVDFAFGNRGFDTITDPGQNNVNILFGGQDDDWIQGGTGVDIIAGGDGADVLDGRSFIDIVLGGASGDAIVGGNDVDILVGGAGDDAIDGQSQLGVLLGLGDSDSLQGGGGVDVLFGGFGNDALSGAGSLDVCIGGHDSDWVFGGSGTDISFGGDGNDQVFGESGADFLWGDSPLVAPSLSCSSDFSGADCVDGGSETDFLFCGLGDDTAYGGTGKDFLFGGRNNDTLAGEDDGSTDRLFGGAGVDTLYKCTQDKRYGGICNDDYQSSCPTTHCSDKRCGTIAGQVLTSDGTPVLGVRVYVDENGNDNFESSEPSALTTVRGRYRIGNVAAGGFGLRGVLPLGYSAIAPVERSVANEHCSVVLNQDFTLDDACKPAPDGLSCAPCPCDGTIVPVYANQCSTNRAPCAADADCACGATCVPFVVDCVCQAADIVLADCFECNATIVFLLANVSPGIGLGTVRVDGLAGNVVIDSEDQNSIAITPVDATTYQGLVPTSDSVVPSPGDGVLACRDLDTIRITNQRGPLPPIVTTAAVAGDCPDHACTAETVTTFTNTTAVDIPAGPAVVSSRVFVAGQGVFLNRVRVITDLVHTSSADLDITLTSPAGTVVTLTSDNGGGNDNVFDGTQWDVNADPHGQVPYTSNPRLVTDAVTADNGALMDVASEESLGAFYGENPNGAWTLRVSDDLAANSGTLRAWSLEVTSVPEQPNVALYSFTNATPTAVPDLAVVSSTLPVAGVGEPIGFVRLVTYLRHTFPADLDVTLTSPSGTVVTITTDNGVNNDNVFDGTVWDDFADPGNQVPFPGNMFSASKLVTDAIYASLVVKPTLVPEEALAAFRGEDPNGAWTLTISDDEGNDVGSLDQWSLEIFTADCP